MQMTLVLLLSPLLSLAGTNFGGPHDFGIPFQPVTPEVTQAFWAAYKASDNLAHEAGPANGSYLPANHPLRGILGKAVAEFGNQAADWLKASCASIDMDSLAKGNLRFTEAKKKIPKNYFPDGNYSSEQLLKEFGTVGAFWAKTIKSPRPEFALYDCNFEKFHGYDTRRGANPRLPPESIAGSDWKIEVDPRRLIVRTPELEEGKSHLLYLQAGLSARNKRSNETWYGTPFLNLDPDTGNENSGGSFAGTTAFSFIVVNDFLVPERSHGTSKSLPVPVARFDRRTGKILGYYDFGLLVLQSFPEKKPVILVSISSEEKVKKFIETKDEKLFGSLGRNPGDMHRYIPLGQMPASTPYWNYDRIPVGSVHFIANAVWSEGIMKNKGDGILAQIPREKLIELYLNNSAWINTYDQNLSDGMTNPPTKSTLEKLTQGECVDSILPADIPRGHWLAHEIILGGEAGRKAIFQESRLVPVLDGCGKAQ